MNLSVKVSAAFYLDAGTVIESDDSYLINPPPKTMFAQLCDWLLCQPDAGGGANNWLLGIGATALCIRWGTYLSILMDEAKPIDERAKDYGTQMISNQEMKRINIEASSNLAYVLELMHHDELEAVRLLCQAYHLLPMPQRHVKPTRKVFDWIMQIMRKFGDQSSNPHYKDAAATVPYRLLANMVVYLAYRNNTPLEDFHGGNKFAYRLTHRRFTKRQTSALIRTSAENISGTMGTPYFWDSFPAMQPWPQRVNALTFSEDYPHNWSLTESSSKITLNKKWTR